MFDPSTEAWLSSFRSLGYDRRENLTSILFCLKILLVRMNDHQMNRVPIKNRKKHISDIKSTYCQRSADEKSLLSVDFSELTLPVHRTYTTVLNKLLYFALQNLLVNIFARACSKIEQPVCVQYYVSRAVSKLPPAHFKITREFCVRAHFLKLSTENLSQRITFL